MADSMLVYVENPMKPIKNVIRIDKWVLQTNSKMHIEIQKIKSGQNYFKKNKVLFKETYTTWFQDS